MSTRTEHKYYVQPIDLKPSIDHVFGNTFVTIYAGKIMKAHISWAGNASFIGESGSGHKITMDGPPDHGGQNLGPRPMEMLLLGLGGCTAFDVMSMLKKS